MTNNQIQKKTITVAQLVQMPSMKARFEEVLGKKAPQFLAGVSSAVNTNPALKNCDPMSVMGSAMTAATLDLPVVPGLGMAALVPYKGNVQFQVMVGGLTQLAFRTGQVSKLNSGVLYKDEYDGTDLITGDVRWHQGSGMREKGDPEDIAGYTAYIRLSNGFEKTVFWSRTKVTLHARRFSKSFDRGPWRDNFDAMAQKTVLKHLLNHYAPKTVEMQTALNADQAVYHGMDVSSYDDNPLKDAVQEGAADPDDAMAERAAIQAEESKPVEEPEGAENPF